MFINSLKISSNDKTIRKIDFNKGINLIVDETPVDTKNETKTGNNVGKTTVLKLIDFCLGANSNKVYLDKESKKDYELVKNFLIKNEILITLVLTKDFECENSEKIIIERNFLSEKKKKICKINGESYTDKTFEGKLRELIFPNLKANKPSFRQIISHNIRYDDDLINNTLKTLGPFAKLIEYETLYLYLLGCTFEKGEEKLVIDKKITQETDYKSRLEKTQDKNAYEVALKIICEEIDELNKKKSTFNLNENFKKDLDDLDSTKYLINRKSSEISSLGLRKSIIEEAQSELRSTKSNIDLDHLKILYQQVSANVSNIQKTFEDLVEYHNTMLEEKIKYISKELPQLEENIKKKQAELDLLLTKEKKLSAILAKSDSIEELEKLISELNEKYHKKGEYETIISQITDAESNIVRLTNEIQNINKDIYSEEFENKVKNQTYKFSSFFSKISDKLYGEQYLLKSKIGDYKGRQIYKFDTFNYNMSSGKKQGEILCFDLAYTLFADSENIPCLHFLLNDKKELMDNKQLVKLKEFLEGKNIQFVASILKHKLPEQLNNEDYFVIKLSQEDKLFKIENQAE
uniref:DUF2326 domain-containing protein n=1 Tax=Methanococcus maripaludis (strain C6 / ATCC BAA-1332) TaxID=444158 RepID=A9A7E9_METM6